MNVRIVLAMLGLFPYFMGCAHAGKPASDRELRRMEGIVVTYLLAKGASNKEGVQALSDSGYRLFGPALLTPRGGGTSSLGNAPFPRWVDVTWREGTDQAAGLYWTTGKIAGNYRVEVLSRIWTAPVFNRLMDANNPNRWYFSQSGQPANTWKPSAKHPRQMPSFGGNQLNPHKIPEEVLITWREMPPSGGQPYTGELKGPYRVKVRERIPDEVLKQARRDGFSVNLSFSAGELPILFNWPSPSASQLGRTTPKAAAS